MARNTLSCNYCVFNFFCKSTLTCHVAINLPCAQYSSVSASEVKAGKLCALTVFPNFTGSTFINLYFFILYERFRMSKVPADSKACLGLKGHPDRIPPVPCRRPWPLGGPHMPSLTCHPTHPLSAQPCQLSHYLCLALEM